MTSRDIYINDDINTSAPIRYGTFGDADQIYGDTANGNLLMVIRSTRTFKVRKDTGSTTTYIQEWYRGGDVLAGRVQTNGDFESATGSYGTTSDERLKADIVDASSQWDDIKAVRLRNYRLLSDPDETVMLGVVAQELELTSPSLVTEDENGIKSVKTSVLHTKALGALQEALARIEALEAQVAALQALHNE